MVPLIGAAGATLATGTAGVAAGAGAASAGGGAALGPWGLAAMFAIQALTARTAAKAQLRVANAQVAAGASNALSTTRTSAAATTLASVQNSLRSQKFVRQGSVAMETLLLNSINADKDAVAQSVETQIANAESDGARIALHGAGGLSTTADAVDAASAIRFARATRRSERVRTLTAYGYSQQAEALAEQVWAGAPSSLSVPSYTPTPQIAQVGAVPSLLGVALTGLLKGITADPAGAASSMRGLFTQDPTAGLYPAGGTPQAGP